MAERIFQWMSHFYFNKMVHLILEFNLHRRIPANHTGYFFILLLIQTVTVESIQVN